MIYSPTRITLPSQSNFRRTPPREPRDRQSNYLERFDFTTLFSDVFTVADKVWMIGPPFLNLERELRASTFTWNWENVTSQLKFENLNRISRASFPVGSSHGVLQIEGPLGRWTVNIEPAPVLGTNGSHLLATQQQDNRLEWIAYWALYNVYFNGIDSIVVYDNMSELYPAERVDQVLAQIPGLKSHMVVKWDTPFGLTGGDNAVWDSDFGQHVYLEHLRRSFGTDASCVLVIDVDELPYSLTEKRLVDQLLDSSAPALFFGRQPIRQYPNRSGKFDGLRVHGDFSLGESKGAWLANKYAFVPNRLPERAQLLVHRIENLGFEGSPSSEISSGHFDAIRIRWRQGEKNQVPTVQDPKALSEAVDRVVELDKSFDELNAKWAEVKRNLEGLIGSQESH